MKVYLSPSSQWDNAYENHKNTEAEICGIIGQCAKVALERNGYTVKLGDNKSTTLQQRAAESNSWGADLHIPIHTNAGGGDGTLVMTYPSTTSDKYVTAVYNEIASLSPGKDDGIKGVTNLYEVTKTKAICIYTEVEFHDNPSYSQWIVDHTEDIGEAFAKALCKADAKTYKQAGNIPSAVTPAKLYRVQTGAFADKSNAEAMVKRLAELGIESFIK